MKLIHGMSPIEFDLYVSSRYRIKANDAKVRSLEFGLTFSEFRKLCARRVCQYTGIRLTLPAEKQKNTDMSFERVDNSKGYVSGNVITVCFAANNIKSVFENPNHLLQVEHAVKMFATISKMQKGLK
jgi:hypothetical protein